MTNIITGKELSKMIKDAITTKFGKMKGLKVSASKKDIKVTFYDIELSDVKEEIENIIDGLIHDKFINLLSIELWKEFTDSYMKENDWMKDDRFKTIKIYNKVKPTL